MLDGLTLQDVVFRLVAILVLIGLMGFITAAIAGLLGDNGPRQDGRLTLNPFQHLDVGGILGAIVAQIGWMRAMPIDASRLRPGRLGLALCVALSLVAALLLAAFSAWLATRMRLSLAGNSGLYLAIWLETLGRVAVWFAIINVVPLPPLLGYHFLAAAAPAARRILPYAPYISVALVVLLLLKLPQRALAPVFEQLATLLLR